MGALKASSNLNNRPLFYVMVLRGEAVDTAVAYSGKDTKTHNGKILPVVTQFIEKTLEKKGVLKHVLVRHWDAFQATDLKQKQKIYILWARRIPPGNFRALMKHSTVTIAEGANTGAFCMENGIPLMTPMK